MENQNILMYSDIVEVKTLHIDSVVNRYLDTGWVLLFVGQYSCPDGEDPLYIVGRRADIKK